MYVHVRLNVVDLLQCDIPYLSIQFTFSFWDVLNLLDAVHELMRPAARGQSLQNLSGTKENSGVRVFQGRIRNTVF